MATTVTTLSAGASTFRLRAESRPIPYRCPHIQASVVDLNAERIAAWNDPDLSKLPFYEPGLAALVDWARGRNLHFSTEVDAAIAAADMVSLSVNTPTKTKGVGAGQASDLRWIEASARQVAAPAGRGRGRK
jgi:UDPglucose 6-dehydrogenase